jgi:hypothetical protein
MGDKAKLGNGQRIIGEQEKRNQEAGTREWERTLLTTTSDGSMNPKRPLLVTSNIGEAREPGPERRRTMQTPDRDP